MTRYCTSVQVFLEPKVRGNTTTQECSQWFAMHAMTAQQSLAIIDLEELELSSQYRRRGADVNAIQLRGAQLHGRATVG